MYVYHYWYVRLNSLISLNSLNSKATSEKHSYVLHSLVKLQRNKEEGTIFRLITHLLLYKYLQTWPDLFWLHQIPQDAAALSVHFSCRTARHFRLHIIPCPTTVNSKVHRSNSLGFTFSLLTDRELATSLAYVKI